MDLSFVTERILSLSFPADISVHLYRDGLRQAAAMLQTKHGDNYMVTTFNSINFNYPIKSVCVTDSHEGDVHISVLSCLLN